jgi:predicted metal-dependent phosphoesterase TrpH
MGLRKAKIDLHVHTRGSDGIGSPVEIAKAAKAAGLTGLAITDHHLTYTAEGLEVARECRKLGLDVFHGCEYSTDDGHLLIFGVNVEELALGRYPKMQEAIQKVNKAGGVAIPAHPYKGYKRLLGHKVLKLKGIKAVEGANGQCAVKNERANNLAKNAGRSRKLGLTGGSDAHFPKHVGICYTKFDTEVRTEKDLLKALKSGKFKALIARKSVRKEKSRLEELKLETLESKLAVQRLKMKRKRAEMDGVPFTREMFESAIDKNLDPFDLDR